MKYNNPIVINCQKFRSKYLVRNIVSGTCIVSEQYPNVKSYDSLNDALEDVLKSYFEDIKNENVLVFEIRPNGKDIEKVDIVVFMHLYLMKRLRMRPYIVYENKELNKKSAPISLYGTSGVAHVRMIENVAGFKSESMFDHKLTMWYARILTLSYTLKETVKILNEEKLFTENGKLWKIANLRNSLVKVFGKDYKN